MMPNPYTPVAPVPLVPRGSPISLFSRFRIVHAHFFLTSFPQISFQCFSSERLFVSGAFHLQNPRLLFLKCLVPYLLPEVLFYPSSPFPPQKSFVGGLSSIVFLWSSLSSDFKSYILSSDSAACLLSLCFPSKCFPKVSPYSSFSFPVCLFTFGFSCSLPSPEFRNAP